MAHPNNFTKPDKFVLLWSHESERVYADRLSTEMDILNFKQLMVAVVRRRFPQFNNTLGKYHGGAEEELLLFSHFITDIDKRRYDQNKDLDALKGVLEDTLASYNEDKTAINLVMFQDAIQHVCRISRIILNPKGNALLVGVGGSGKRSLSRLAAYCCGYVTREIVEPKTVQ